MSRASHAEVVGAGLAGLTAAIAGLLTAASAIAAPPGLTGTSTEDHVWLVARTGDAEAGNEQYQLLHHARIDDGPYLRSHRTLTREPEALAAGLRHE